MPPPSSFISKEPNDRSGRSTAQLAGTVQVKGTVNCDQRHPRTTIRRAHHLNPNHVFPKGTKEEANTSETVVEARQQFVPLGSNSTSRDDAVTVANKQRHGGQCQREQTLLVPTRPSSCAH